MAETVAKRTAKEEAAEKGRRDRPKDAQDTESQASYYARRYMESQVANTNMKVQSEIDEITGRMIERKAKKDRLIFRPMKKS